MQVKLGCNVKSPAKNFLYIIRNLMMIFISMDVGTSIFADVKNKTLTMANKLNTVTTYKLGH